MLTSQISLLVPTLIFGPKSPTNHTIMAEALEKWPIDLFSKLLPRIYQIIQEIDRRFIEQIRVRFPGDEGRVARMAIIRDGQVKMAHLAIVAGYSVNGVARLHTEILKHEELKDFYDMMPEKFNNKTNGITQRRLQWENCGSKFRVRSSSY